MRLQAAPEARNMPAYNCKKCPGYCCSYPLIALDKRDVERLAKHHNLSFDEARTKFTKRAHGRRYAMRRKGDLTTARSVAFSISTRANARSTRRAPRSVAAFQATAAAAIMISWRSNAAPRTTRGGSRLRTTMGERQKRVGGQCRRGPLLQPIPGSACRPRRRGQSESCSTPSRPQPCPTAR